MKPARPGFKSWLYFLVAITTWAGLFHFLICKIGLIIPFNPQNFTGLLRELNEVIYIKHKRISDT